ncbi:hypothetical protein EV426DRAFT_615004 [Tirmania nivea]|nr:hypothetical protein EV426DRAFT_615004 [Tirmania nivea]
MAAMAASDVLGAMRMPTSTSYISAGSTKYTDTNSSECGSSSSKEGDCKLTANDIAPVAVIRTVEMEEVYSEEYNKGVSVEIEMMVDTNMMEAFGIMTKGNEERDGSQEVAAVEKRKGISLDFGERVIGEYPEDEAGLKPVGQARVIGEYSRGEMVASISGRNGPGRPTGRRRPGQPAKVRAGLKQLGPPPAEYLVVWVDLWATQASPGHAGHAVHAGRSRLCRPVR